MVTIYRLMAQLATVVREETVIAKRVKAASSKKALLSGVG